MLLADDFSIFLRFYLCSIRSFSTYTGFKNLMYLFHQLFLTLLLWNILKAIDCSVFQRKPRPIYFLSALIIWPYMPYQTIYSFELQFPIEETSTK